MNFKPVFFSAKRNLLQLLGETQHQVVWKAATMFFIVITFIHKHSIRPALFPPAHLQRPKATFTRRLSEVSSSGERQNRMALPSAAVWVTLGWRWDEWPSMSISRGYTIGAYTRKWWVNHKSNTCCSPSTHPFFDNPYTVCTSPLWFQFLSIKYMYTKRRKSVSSCTAAWQNCNLGLNTRTNC